MSYCGSNNQGKKAGFIIPAGRITKYRNPLVLWCSNDEDES
jgi:hypothetical protein